MAGMAVLLYCAIANGQPSPRPVPVIADDLDRE